MAGHDIQSLGTMQSTDNCDLEHEPEARELYSHGNHVHAA